MFRTIKRWLGIKRPEYYIRIVTAMVTIEVKAESKNDLDYLVTEHLDKLVLKAKEVAQDVIAEQKSVCAKEVNKSMMLSTPIRSGITTGRA